MRSVVVHYQELALKGRNRPWFVKQLVGNLRTVVSGLDVTAVKALMGRLEIALGPAIDWPELETRLARIFGVANFSRAGRVPLPDVSPEALDAIAAAILRDLPPEDVDSFRVLARRADKRVPMTSPDIEREVGGRIKMARGWHVNLTRPALTIHLEMLTAEAFYYFGKHRGAGGLPTGSSGRVVCLLSGGIDSPVAAFRMMRRGCRVHLLHFHSYPLVSMVSQEKVRQIAEILTRHQLKTRLLLAPFGALQKRVILTVPPPLRVVIYRRLMFRIADRVASQMRAGALVTGEVIGQVASQTLENLSVINDVTRMPVLRPLVGFDKDEITSEAQRIGTYPISIVPDEDCCQLFTPKHPSTKARPREVEAAEAALPIDDLVAEAVAGIQAEELTFP